MKRLFFILAVFTLFSCEQSKGKKAIRHNSEASNLSVVVIDTCEYLQFQSHGYKSITHKGNCKKSS
jgi:hypothetical protein